MRFNPKARLDTSRVRDRGRGSGGGRSGGLGGGTGGGGLPIPGGVAGGGGITGVIVIVLFIVLTQCVGGGDTGGAFDTGRMADTNRYENCKTGEDANKSADCARVAVENSLYDYWGDELGSTFRAEKEVDTFTGATSTGCGQASSDVGPFYCPVDETIYLDTTFFDDVLERQLGGPEGGFVEPYVLAHEYGHHIQNVLGTMGKVKTQQGPKSDSVRLELQADCYAGMWAKAATTTEDASGQVLFASLTDQDIQQAIEAATAVGDDRIQERSGGRVNPEQWTHGSAQQRVDWFTTGYTLGDLDACDTFAAGAL
jgi:predicted metalloprotease